jgi:hypothetical protein
MMNKLPGTVILLLISIYSSAQPKVESIINTRQLKPAVLHWDFGTLETIYPSEDSLGIYWNVIHRSPEPTKPYDDYDYFKVEGKTLRPLISEMYHRGFIDYRIEFKQQQAEVTIGTDRDTTHYFLDIPEFISPEGPGSPLFWGSLPLKPGFEIQYDELDRWAGSGERKGLVVRKTLKVTGEEPLLIDDKKLNTYILSIKSEKGSNLTVWVMKQAPHYWGKVIYKPTPDREMRSQVTKIFILG